MSIEIREIQIYHKELLERKKEVGIDEVTWNDLEMDDIFYRINQTQSYMGEQILYHRLHDNNAKRDWDKFEEEIEFLQKNEQMRKVLEKKLAKIGKREEDYHLPTFLMHPEYWKIQKIWIYRILQLILLVFVGGAILTRNDVFVGGMILSGAVNLMVYFSTKHNYEILLCSLGSLKQLLLFAKTVSNSPELKREFVNEEVGAAMEELLPLCRKLTSFQGRKYAALTGDISFLLQDYLLGMTLYDVCAFNRIMKLIDKKQDKVQLLYEFAGELDLKLSVLFFRKSLNEYCIPVIGKTDHIEARDIYHPLLENPVANDFTLQHRGMITGANASGKSTFMKALAVNVILAQTIHTVTAKEFAIPRLGVMTSMALRDDILTGESYYIREAKYLKRMLDAVTEEAPILCVIDEILKGTNTTERLAASEAILRYFAEKNCFVLVATHDMELVEALQNSYENYYFESHVFESDIIFDYCIHKGIGGSSNAIALLTLLKYPKEIVEQAKRSLNYENR